MPDLLLELYSEEIPARMQQRAEADFARLMLEALAVEGLKAAACESFSGPRRLALLARGLPTQSASTVEERKGPRVNAPEKAVEGFLRSAGVKVSDLEVVQDPKGDYYLARTERPGRPAEEIIAAVAPEVIAKFPWPKSMRWGSGRLRWVRPLHSILCLFADKPVYFEVEGVKSGPITFGHRFLSGNGATQPKIVEIRKSRDYAARLLQAKVVVSRDRRASAILAGAKAIADDAGLALVDDHGLLDENAGLVEWPVVLSGTFDKSFLEVPEEILITAMKTHQKCFSLRNIKSKKLANRFILVANIEAADGGAAIVAGNERVIRARLSDAKFFWDNDKAHSLASLTQRLADVTFHEKLGTQLARVQRIVTWAGWLSGPLGADKKLVREAASYCKADLMSETVGEFPELQGIIGRYLALAQGHDAAIADALRDHYRPQGPADAVPTHPVSIAVALAEKVDMLAAFWAIEEKPTGSKDPFALRRAALGVIRIVLENELRIRLRPLFILAIDRIEREMQNAEAEALALEFSELGVDVSFSHRHEIAEAIAKRFGHNAMRAIELADDLLAFFADRLKVHLREKGARHDLIDAVFALPGQDDLLMIVRRVEALGRFLETEDGASLLALVRRALNILKIEEKKDNVTYAGKPIAKKLHNREEKALAAAIAEVGGHVATALTAEDYEAAMLALARLRQPVDTFFDKVTVNADDADIRENRLKLLNGIRELTLAIADFGKIEG